MPKEKNEFTKKEVAEVLGMKPNTIAFYTNEGLIIPEIANPVGRGTRRKYSKNNLVEILLLRTLTSHGISLGNIEYVINELRRIVFLKTAGHQLSLKDKASRIFSPINYFDKEYLKNNRIFLIFKNPHRKYSIYGVGNDYVPLSFKCIPINVNEPAKFTIDMEYYQDFSTDNGEIDIYTAYHESTLVINITSIFQKIAEV